MRQPWTCARCDQPILKGQHVAGAMLMKTFMREGPLLVILANGRRRYRGKIPAAAVENMVTRLARIVSHGSDANSAALARGLRRGIPTTEERQRPRIGDSDASDLQPAPRKSRSPGRSAAGQLAGRAARRQRSGVRGRMSLLLGGRRDQQPISESHLQLLLHHLCPSLTGTETCPALHKEHVRE